MYDQSHHCHVWFLSQVAHNLINHDNSVSILAQTAPIRSIFVSVIFVIDRIRSEQAREFSFHFDINRTFIINHVVVLCHFRYRFTQFDQSWQFSFIFIIDCTLPNWSWLFSFVFGIDCNYSISHNFVCVILSYTTPIQSLTSLFYVNFVTNCTWSNQSWQLRFIFGVDHTDTIGHVVVSCHFHHRSHPA